MKIDLHNHTTTSSSCSILDVRDLIRLAKEMGLDAVCVTDHNTPYGGKVAEEAGREMGMPVVGGMEVASEEGDILTFGIFREGLSGISVAELIRIAESDGGVLIPAHPYRSQALSMGDRLFDYPGAFTAIEGMNGNLGDEMNGKAMEAARRMGLPCTGGSDAHSVQMVGRFYTDFDDDLSITDSDSLIAALKTGRYRPAANPLFGRNAR